MTEITAAQRWALRFIVENPDQTPATIGVHCAERPGMRRAGNGILHTSQGFGRLGAHMSRLLADRGLVEIRFAPPHYKYTYTRATDAGRQALQKE